MKSRDMEKQAARRCRAAFGGTFGIPASGLRAHERGTAETESGTRDDKPGRVRE